MGSVSTIPVPAGLDTPAVPAFVPDRLGVRRVQIETDRATGRVRASLTPCPATATAWGPTDAPEVSCPDLIGELLALPASPAKGAALTAVQRITADLVTVAAAVIAGRE
jgi:hypothetical protein